MGECIVGINGACGRIGKHLLAVLSQPEYYEAGIRVGMLNDAAGEAEILKSLTGFDQVTHARPEIPIEIRHNQPRLYGKPLLITAKREINEIHWERAGISIVEDCTGISSPSLLEEHIEEVNDEGLVIRETGVRYVISAAPLTQTPTLIMGVNHELFEPEKHRVISNGSCTSKALALPLKVLRDRGYKPRMVEFYGDHAATNSQRMLGSLNNISIHSSGASDVLPEIFPELKGQGGESKVFGCVARVPVDRGSFAKLYVAAEGEKPIHTPELQEWLREAAGGYEGRLAVIDEKSAGLQHIVNSEFSKFSSVVVLPHCRVLFSQGIESCNDAKGHYAKYVSLVSLLIGYDNESGPAHDQALLTKYIAQKGFAQ